MTDPSTIRIGFVSLGQGPRPDLEAMHQRLFAARGYWLDSVWAHVLDGLSAGELDALRASDGAPAIRALHSGEGHSMPQTGPQNGAQNGGQSPAQSSWFSRDALTARLGAAISAVEAQDVQLTIICAAEMLPAFDVRTKRPVILPAEAMAAQAQMLARTRPDASIGLIVYGDRQRDQQLQGWRDRPFAKDLALHFSGSGGDPDAAVRDLAPCDPDLVLIWAYGAATAQGAPQQISRALRVPVVTASEAAVSVAMMFLAGAGR